MFSIITATYNRAHSIGNTIESVLAQDYQDWELIIIDDGSTDNTQAVVSKYTDPRIKYFYFAENRGCNAARNQGAKVARYKWLAAIDSDDLLAKNALNIMRKTIQKYNFPFVRFVAKNLRGKYTVAESGYEGYISYIDLLRGKFPGEYLTLIHADLMRRHPFPEDICGGEGITWRLIAKELGKVLLIPQVTRIYDDESSDRLSNVWRNIPRICEVYKKEFKVLGDEYRHHILAEYRRRRLKYILLLFLKKIIKFH